MCFCRISKRLHSWKHSGVIRWGRKPASGISSYSQQAVSSSAKPVDEKNEVRTVVESFGKAIKDVSLDASDADIDQRMKAAYAKYLTPNLLEEWEGHPSVRAAGKLPAGPWPDHVEISDIVKNADHSYTVKGTLIEVKNKSQSNSVVSKRSAELKVVLLNGKWLIGECLFGNAVPAGTH
jgi:hypothetical protein